MQIIVKKYDHINSALPGWDTPKGKYIKSKDHYDRCLKEAGMVSYEKNNSGPKLKDYILSKKAKEIINTASNSKDKKGRVRLDDRTIDAMKDIGAIGRKISDKVKLPNNVNNGGFFQI